MSEFASNELTELARRQLRGKRLRQIRSRSGLSIREVAAKAGLDKNTILRLEAGGIVRESTWRRACDAFGIVSADGLIDANPDEGRHFQRHRLEDDYWHKLALLDPTQPSVVSTTESIQDRDTRRWLGSKGISNQFIKRLRCDRPEGQIRAAVLEVYGPSGWSAQPSGEAFVYCLAGSVTFYFETEQFTLVEGEAATFDRTRRHMHDITNAPEPAVLLYVQVD